MSKCHHYNHYNQSIIISVYRNDNWIVGDTLEEITDDVSRYQEMIATRMREGTISCYEIILYSGKLIIAPISGRISNEIPNFSWSKIFANHFSEFLE